MKSFKFFGDNDEEEIEPLRDASPSWMWVEEIGLSSFPNQEWILMTERCYGIRSFLNLFPDLYIIPVESITGNGITHTFGNRNDGNGWGFDILSEELTIQYYVPRVRI